MIELVGDFVIGIVAVVIVGSYLDARKRRPLRRKGEVGKPLSDKEPTVEIPFTKAARKLDGKVIRVNQWR
jgi:hypothetical protein